MRSWLVFIGLAGLAVVLAVAGLVVHAPLVTAGSVVAAGAFGHVAVRLRAGDDTLDQARLGWWGVVAVVLGVTGWNVGGWSGGGTAWRVGAAVVFVVGPSLLLKACTRRREHR